MLMFTKLRRIFSVRRDDRGDGILVMGVIFIPLMVIVAGLAMDLMKAVYIKSSFQSYGQEAVSNAVRYVNDRGGLTESAVFYAIANYMAQTNGSAGVTSASTTAGTNEVRGFVRQGQCTEVNVPGVGVKKAPYIVVKLKAKRGKDEPASNTWVYESSIPTMQSGAMNPTDRVLEMTVYEAVPNIMLGMAGVPCQEFRTEVSAITFGNQEDISESSAGDGAAETPPYSWVPTIFDKYDICYVEGNSVRWPTNIYKRGSLVGEYFAPGASSGYWTAIASDVWPVWDLGLEGTSYRRFMISGRTLTDEHIVYACENPNFKGGEAPPSWVEDWTSLENWTETKPGWVAEAPVAHSETHDATMTRQAGGRITKFYIDGSNYNDVHFIDASGQHLFSVESLSGYASVRIRNAAGNTSSASLVGGAYTVNFGDDGIARVVGDGGWTLQLPYTGNPTGIKVVSRVFNTGGTAVVGKMYVTRS